MNDIICIDKNKTADFALTGNYLFESEGENYFYNRFNSTFFTVEENLKLNENGLEKLKNDYENYVLKLCELCKASSVKPSLMFFNNILPADKIKEILNNEYENITDEKDLKKLCDNPGFYIDDKSESIESAIKYLIELRSIGFPSNKVIIVLNKPEEINIKSLVYFVTLARSRDIYFYILNYDLEKLNSVYYPSDVQAIFMNCKNHFYSNNDGMYEFRYISYDDEKSFKTQKFKNKNIVPKFFNLGNFNSYVSVKFKNFDK